MQVKDFYIWSITKEWRFFFTEIQMIKYILFAVLAISAVGQSALADQQYPTGGMFQEMAGTIAKGKVSIDLINSTSYRDSVRIGLPRGELIYSRNVAGVPGDLLDYKHPINGNLAAYGLINFDSNADGTDLLLGVAYSGGDGKFWYNINGEILSPGNGGDSTSPRDHCRPMTPYPTLLPSIRRSLTLRPCFSPNFQVLPNLN